MSTINRLSSTDTLAAGDLLAVYKQSQGDARKASLTTLMTFINANLTVSGAQITQYAAPSSTGFSVTVGAGGVWLILTPTGTFANGAIVLPDGPTDKDLVTVNCTQIVSALTVTSAKTVTGEPTALTANGFFSMRYDAATGAWFRVG
tara:strand:+ start:4992 stop:5432 length:441 start_codon:yes stop_codon:yes gene_type:complete